MKVNYSILFVSVGYSAGKKWNKYGSGANYLCLTKTPEWGDLQTRGTISELYGVEIDAPDVADSLEVPCSVCRLLFRFSLVMIPGRKTCPNIRIGPLNTGDI